MYRRESADHNKLNVWPPTKTVIFYFSIQDEKGAIRNEFIIICFKMYDMRKEKINNVGRSKDMPFPLGDQQMLPPCCH
jgi:hypothetical protein